jgi:chorismate dehydratase
VVKEMAETTLSAPTLQAASERDRRSEGNARAGVLRLGVVSYLNAEPLVYGLAGDARYRLVRDLPARVAEALHRGDSDLGMIPSIEYAFGDYAIVPGLAIGSRGAVRSVNVYHRRPLSEVKKVALDTSSRTSVALTKVLLHETLGGHPEYVAHGPSLPEMLEVADAALVIGDPALYLDTDVPRLDLGEEWQRRTGLPFVYAFWAGRWGAVTRADVERLQRALREGLAAVDRIASAYAGGAAGDPTQGDATFAEGDSAVVLERRGRNASYLRSNVLYSLGEEEQRGLREFYRRAFALGLIPRLPELRFHG